ncbi:MAG: tetratricopeptide repeat protein [Bacteroidetes bacterium]|nr:tetratricopeptide repeat protein [Bacteroidota bacterium]
MSLKNKTSYSPVLPKLLFLFGFLIYANTFTHDYALDDAIVITDNQFTQKGLAGLKGIFTYDTFHGFFREEGKSKLVAGGRYRPLSLATFAMEITLFGSSPLISHLVNALLFALCSYLVFFVLNQIFQHTPEGAIISLFTAFLFAAHPIHTEVVANIKGRDEILAFLGSLMALYLAFKSLKDKKFSWHILGAICLFLGLLSKESAITFLAIIPLTMYFFGGKSASLKNIAIHTFPYLLATLLFLYIRSAVLGLDFGDGSLELMNNPFLKWENGIYIPFNFEEKAATIAYTLGLYVWLLFFPFNLTHDYYPRHIPIITFDDFGAIFSVILYLIMIFYAIKGLKSKNLLSFGISIYLINLSLVSNILFPIGTNLAERLLFAPSLGYTLIAGFLFSKIKPFTLRNYLFLTIFILYAGLTWLRNPAWKDNFTLFTTDLKFSGESAKVRNAAGGELLAQALKTDSLTAIRYRTEAVGHLQKAVTIHPTYKNAWLLLGNAYYYLHNFELAIQAFKQALIIDPGYADASKNMGLAYRDGGRIAGEINNDLMKATAYLKEAAFLLPEDYEAHRLAGIAFGFNGNKLEAISYFQRAAQLKPDLSDAWFNLGTAYYQAGDANNGLLFHQKAISIDSSVKNRMTNPK